MKQRPRPELSSRIVDGERLILDRKNGRVHSLNSTASLVWDRIVAGREPSEIAVELAERFEVAEGQALVDVERILEELDNLDLVVRPANERE